MRAMPPCVPNFEFAPLEIVFSPMQVRPGAGHPLLGPDSEITGLRVGWASVDVEGLRITAPKGRPAADTLRAERIAIAPSLRSVFSR